MCEEINADWLIYQDLDDLIESVRICNPAIDDFETSCFTGKYITGDVSEHYLARLEAIRSDQAKAKQDNNQAAPDDEPELDSDLESLG